MCTRAPRVLHYTPSVFPLHPPVNGSKYEYEFHEEHLRLDNRDTHLVPESASGLPSNGLNSHPRNPTQ